MCYGCGATYVGNMNNKLSMRLKQYTEKHLTQCVEVQNLLNITSLGPTLFSNDNNIGQTDNRNSHINLVVAINNITDCYNSFNVLLFKEAMKINEIKATLNK